MHPEQLLGYWSEMGLAPGQPEFTEIGFRADGTGWIYWSSWSGAFTVIRLAWQATPTGHLTVRMHTEIYGTWTAAHRVEQRTDIDSTRTVAYAVTPGPILTLEHPLDETLGGTEFKFTPGNTDDPTLDPPNQPDQ
ncbi:hypothetical protein [Nocardia sp. NPDC051463]|uniref:hypothetical protein n=1 Tax=Nocardia sp. NPDC051463 TaxID=3154845 RepID=UPI0034325AD8